VIKFWPEKPNLARIHGKKISSDSEEIVDFNEKRKIKKKNHLTIGIK
jgi:hypothetical protein